MKKKLLEVIEDRLRKGEFKFKEIRRVLDNGTVTQSFFGTLEDLNIQIGVLEVRDGRSRTELEIVAGGKGYLQFEPDMEKYLPFILGAFMKKRLEITEQIAKEILEGEHV